MTRLLYGILYRGNETMTVCFSGTRFYDTDSEVNRIKISAILIQIIELYPQTLVFGTCKGIDLNIFNYIVMNLKKYYRPYLINVCPNTLADIDPLDRINVEKYSDEVIELGNPIVRTNWYSSYQLRNEWMVDNSDELYAFPMKHPPKGPKKGGTWNTIKYARRVWSDDDCITITELE